MTARRAALLLAPIRRAVDRELAGLLPRPDAAPAPLARAMRYAVLGGGKRLRPCLTVAACRAAGGLRAEGLAAAAAVELVHAFSLVHDDLPCLDDDDERRGRPTVHRAFGEAVALLAGDALLVLAFETLAVLARRPRVGPERAANAVTELARAAGFDGLVGGETLDILGAGRPLGAAAVRRIHRKKTGRLFEAAARVGGAIGGAPPALLAVLGAFGGAVGSAFQIADDLRDEPVSRDAAARPGTPGAPGRDGADARDSRVRPSPPSIVRAEGRDAAARTARVRPSPPSIVRATDREAAARAARRALADARRAALDLGKEAAAFLALAALVEERLA